MVLVDKVVKDFKVVLEELAEQVIQAVLVVLAEQVVLVVLD